MTENNPQDYLITVSFDLLDYDENDDPFVPKIFEDMLFKIGIPLDFSVISEFYFNQEVGTGDVYLFNITESEFIVFELYRGLTDQCDVVQIGLRVGPEKLEFGNTLMRSLYDHAHFMLSYRQSWKMEDLNCLVDPKKYPKIVESYEQQLHVDKNVFFQKNT